MTKKVSSLLLLMFFTTVALAQPKNPKFKVIAFYTGKSDLAHISFVNEANKWFTEVAEKNSFSYDSTSNWENLNSEFLSKYQVVLFLDTRPEKPEQREAFQKYMENGGAWMGFHFSAFALEKSAYDMNWNWYHNTFLGSGSYSSNTWRPTSAILKVESKSHPVVKNLPKTFKAQPNEWYRWQNDLKKNPDIKILLAIDSTSFPLGTGPKANETWHSGYYPVVWTNKNYKMVYFNMGHNDMDYEHKFDDTNKTLSFTFDNEIQNKMILNSLIWLGTGKKVK
ncbi:ThuA domain-containing protein [Pedobacter sp.]|uniref:ThuA domain-containing protein n=1 Tax=Pedobacter sp. TaxID=1411316 RepID=UPI003BADA09C